MPPTKPDPSSRRQLQQIVAGLSEGVILVDAHQAITWANEAALAMHGVSDLAALGTTVDEYRARFRLRYRNNRRLSKGQYPIERVVSGEAFHDVIVEVTPLGAEAPEWVHRVRSLVLTDDAGEPDYLVLILHDDTERFAAEKRFETSFNVNPAPAVICRLSDQVFIKANRGFLELTGFARDDVIAHSLTEIDILGGIENKEEALECILHSKPVQQSELQLPLANGGRKPVVVAGQPIDVDDEGCMIFTFMDLEPRRSAEEALRQTRAELQADFEALYTETPVPLHSVGTRPTAHKCEQPVARAPWLCPRGGHRSQSPRVYDAESWRRRCCRSGGKSFWKPDSCEMRNISSGRSRGTLSTFLSLYARAPTRLAVWCGQWLPSPMLPNVSGARSNSVRLLPWRLFR